MDALSRIMRSSPRKSEGANSKKAWIIHENKKSSMSRPTVSKGMQDWLLGSNDDKKKDYFNSISKLSKYI